MASFAAVSVRHGSIQTTEAFAVCKLLAQSFAASGGDADDDGGTPLSAAARLQYHLKLLATLQWRASSLGKRFITVLATEPSSGELAGVANVSVASDLELAGAEGHLKLEPGQTASCIFNMAVAEPHRRQGLGRQLLAACEGEACRHLTTPAGVLALSVYRSNEPAIALYEGAGYAVDTSWVDSRWAKSAERGRVEFERRQLMLKTLAAAKQAEE
ncbi:hypothetical protein D9Q98_004906 [Chlorella vulgaris]|uniref:N-acetyltransferase domain-containing protein n=1 Tax=Chlorella vulgaris TaxID=3077 RepID=A0A9D4TNA4_CHLVU|nr:hypothetical protein D9Q98_004906 [Chlorella vulgaris]